MGNVAFKEQIGSVTEQFILEGDDLVVRRSEDAQPVIDAVAKANLNGTTEIEGLGRLVAEVPITLAMEFCQGRGIPWEKFMYTGEYDAEFKRFIAEHQRIAYTHKQKYFGGTA